MNQNRYMNCTECEFYHHNKVNLTTVMPLVKSDGEIIFDVAKSVNIFSCTVIVIIGIIGNLLTFCVLNLKVRNNFKQNRPKLQLNFNSKASFTSSKSYLLALAFSDLLFLISHSFEDILPNLAHFFHTNSKFLLFVNNYSIICKLTLYMRNASRISSSYLIVLFAFERLMICSKPLKRLKFHYKNFNRNLTIAIFAISFLLTSYTPVISGLRKLDKHEEIHGYEKTECDTLQEYLKFYEYVTIAYIFVQIIVPTVAICFLNFQIVKVLMTRKNCKARSYFKSTKSPTVSSQDSTIDYSSEKKHYNIVKIGAPLSSLASISPSNSILQLSNTNTLTLSASTIGLERENSSFIKKTKKKVSLQNSEKRSISMDLIKSLNHPSALEPHQQLTNNKKITNPEVTSAYPNYDLYSNFNNDQIIRTQLSPINFSKQFQKRYSLIPSGLNASHETQAYHPHTQENSCWIFRHSRLLFKLKEAGRVTFILILISIFFVILNIPYLISWLCFFIPYRYKLLTDESAIHKRYTFVYLMEIFHILNFCINFFLYCFSSKIFRKELKTSVLTILRRIFCKEFNCSKIKNCIQYKAKPNCIDTNITVKRIQFQHLLQHSKLPQFEKANKKCKSVKLIDENSSVIKSSYFE